MLDRKKNVTRPQPSRRNEELNAKRSARNSLKSKVILPKITKNRPSMPMAKPVEKNKHEAIKRREEAPHSQHMPTVRNSKDAEIIKEIRALLQVPPYANALVEASGPNGTPKEIYKILLNDSKFAKFPSHHNPERAEYYASELSGLGVIQYLLDMSHKPGHDRITDIGFNSNGYLTIETNKRKFIYGNKPGQPKITRQYIETLVRRMAQQNGYDGDRFDQSTPLFNGSNDANYLRISATHESIAPYGITLSIRVASPYLALTKENFNNFAPMEKVLDVYNLFRILVQCHCNIMLSAETGAGKTEFQKLLVGFIPFQDRIIMVEDTNETHLPDLYPKKDIFSWLTNKDVTITDLVKQSLRNNPKWLIIAETRGAEAYEMFQGVKSDHSIITTLHAISNEAVPSRFVGMCKSGDFKVNEEALERDFLRYIDIGVHLTKKVINGTVIRYADEIAEFVPISKEHPNGVNILFKQHITKKGVREFWTGAPSEALQEKLYNERDAVLQCKPFEDSWRKTGTPKGVEWPIIPKDEKIREQLYHFDAKKK